jgi:hypothetical protein
MSELAHYVLDDGSALLVEITESDGLRRAARPQDVVTTAAASLRSALEPIEPLVRTLATKLRKLPESPDEATVEFGVKLGAEAGIVLARTAVEAHLHLKLTWKSGNADSV